VWIGVALIFAHAALDFSGAELEVTHPQQLVARSSKVQWEFDRNYSGQN
jgi:hypothetical protein